MQTSKLIYNTDINSHLWWIVSSIRTSLARGFLICCVAYRFDPEDSGADFTPQGASCITVYLRGDVSAFASL